jgi:hypothetical protein
MVAVAADIVLFLLGRRYAFKRRFDVPLKVAQVPSPKAVRHLLQRKRMLGKRLDGLELGVSQRKRGRDVVLLGELFHRFVPC